MLNTSTIRGTFKQIPYWKLRGRFHSCGYRDQEVAEYIGIGRDTMSGRMHKITQKLERMVRMMAMLWAQEIMSCETTEEAKAMYARCPRLLKEKVKAILIKSGFEEITQ